MSLKIISVLWVFVLFIYLPRDAIRDRVAGRQYAEIRLFYRIISKVIRLILISKGRFYAEQSVVVLRRRLISQSPNGLQYVSPVTIAVGV